VQSLVVESEDQAGPPCLTMRQVPKDVLGLGHTAEKRERVGRGRERGQERFREVTARVR
jgi:hypothetical protein